MKKRKSIFLIMCLLLLLSGCNNKSEDEVSESIEQNISEVGKSAENLYRSELQEASELVSEEDIIKITEKMYITYINDIYTNFDNYKGKKIQIEGMFSAGYDENTKEAFYVVYRVGPGCCGNDGDMAGFEFVTADPLPEENDWIEVTGVLEEYEQDGMPYIRLKDSKVVVKEERGQEVVYQ